MPGNFNRGFFDEFDPLTGDLPKIVNLDFKYIVKLARALLQHRSSEEIIAAHQDLITLLIRAESDEFTNDHLPRTSRGETISFYPTTVRLLNRCQRLFDLEDDWGFSDGRWSEYYAVMALAIAGQARTSEQIPHPGTTLGSRDHKRRQKVWADELALDALELLGGAYALKAAEDLREQTTQARRKKHFRKIGKIGGHRRHAESAILKELAYNFWKTRKPGNKRGGARDFLKNFPKERIQTALPGEGRIETICKWFREFEKGEIPEIFS